MSKARILIVDDAYSMRSLLRKTMKENDYEVVGEAKNGTEGIALYQELNPDIVTMDINMPDINGIEVTKKILSLNPKAKIIAVTGNSDEAIKKQIWNAGIKDYLSKPFQPAYLWKKLDGILYADDSSEFEAEDEEKQSVEMDDDSDLEDDMEIIILNKPDENKIKTLIIENNEDNLIFPEEFTPDDKNILSEENLLTYDNDIIEEEQIIQVDVENVDEIQPELEQEKQNDSSIHDVPRIKRYAELEVDNSNEEDECVAQGGNADEFTSHNADMEENETAIKPENNDAEETYPSFGSINIKPPRGRILQETYPLDDDCDSIAKATGNVSNQNNYNDTEQKSGLLNKVKKLFKKPNNS